MGAYADFHRRSIEDRESFWTEEAQRIYWHRPFDRVLDFSKPPLPNGSSAVKPIFATTRLTGIWIRAAISLRWSISLPKRIPNAATVIVNCMRR